MPSIAPASLVLVTGASGFIAAFTCVQLLERGFKVRGTVRSEDKGKYLTQLFESKGVGKDWSFVIVEDVEKEDGFDAAVKGVDGIAHIASPFHFKVEDPRKDLIDPAVNGTLSILKSAKKNGTNVKRVVITSSFASILTPKEPVYTFTEKDWNDTSPKLVEEKGKDAPPAESYRASKVLAERAAWAFVEQEKPAFDIATVCPPLVLGPLIHQVKSPGSLNTSVEQFYKFLTGEKTGEDAQPGAGNMVDVRDVAHAHIEALVRQAAGGNRFAIAKTPFSWQDCLDALHDSPAAKAWPKAPKGTPGSGKQVKQNILDSSKSVAELGIQYKDFKQTIADMAASLEEQAKKW